MGKTWKDAAKKCYDAWKQFEKEEEEKQERAYRKFISRSTSKNKENSCQDEQ